MRRSASSATGEPALRGDDVEPVGAVLADLHHLAAAAGAAPVLRLDHALDARQVGRQRAMRLRPLGAVRLHRLVSGSRGALVVAGLRLGEGGLDFLEGKRELIGVELLRARPEPGAAHLPQQHLQPRRIGLLVGDLRLEMRPRRALGLKLGTQHGEIGYILGGGHGGRVAKPGARTTKKSAGSEA